MKQGGSFLLRTTVYGIAVLGVFLSLVSEASADILFTLEGNSPQAKNESNAVVRLSLINWSDQKQGMAMVDAYSTFKSTMKQDDFMKFVQDQPTLGYLFTSAATGYTVKYAWQEPNSDSKRMVFLVTPALKTRSPYIWKSRNTDDKPFTLVELRWTGDQATVKTSMDGDIKVNTMGHNLELDNFQSAQTFATMRDDTPYYQDDKV